MTSVDKKTFLKELRWQAAWRWWHRDLPLKRRPMDKVTYRAVKRRLRREALRKVQQE